MLRWSSPTILACDIYANVVQTLYFQPMRGRHSAAYDNKSLAVTIASSRTELMNSSSNSARSRGDISFTKTRIRSMYTVGHGTATRVTSTTPRWHRCTRSHATGPTSAASSLHGCHQNRSVFRCTNGVYVHTADPFSQKFVSSSACISSCSIASASVNPVMCWFCLTNSFRVGSLIFLSRFMRSRM